MKLAINLAALLCLVPASAFAGTWTGYLVDSRCYEIEEQNTNPFDTNPYVDRDKDLEIRLCSPNAKTKSFALVQRDWLRVKFDSAGNAKAAKLVRMAGKKTVFLVTVTGEKNKTSVKVDSISLAQ